MTDDIFNAMAASIMEGDAERAEQLASEALEAGLNPLQAINQGFVVGLDKIGELFGAGEAGAEAGRFEDSPRGARDSGGICL